MFTNPNIQQANLGNVNQAHLMALSQQGNESLTYAALMEQANTQRAMQLAANETKLEVPKVNFYPSNNPDPRKARRKDIKQAYKLLTPSKRSMFNPVRWVFGRKYRYNKQSNVCVIDGCDCAVLIQHENLYAKIADEDTGRTIWEMYWQNPVTGEPEAFTALERVTGGRKMRGTYCPEHMHLYHLLVKWEAEEDKIKESNPKRLKDRVKQGVSIVTVPISTIKNKDPTPKMLEKYEPFFDELMRDARKTKGISVMHYTNPATNQNDMTMIVFDLRIFQQEMLMQAQPTAAFQALINQGINPNPQSEEGTGEV
jgi:hypothetical protein